MRAAWAKKFCWVFLFWIGFFAGVSPTFAFKTDTAKCIRRILRSYLLYEENDRAFDAKKVSAIAREIDHFRIRLTKKASRNPSDTQAEIEAALERLNPEARDLVRKWLDKNPAGTSWLLRRIRHLDLLDSSSQVQILKTFNGKSGLLVPALDSTRGTISLWTLTQEQRMEGHRSPEAAGSYNPVSRSMRVYVGWKDSADTLVQEIGKKVLREIVEPKLPRFYAMISEMHRHERAIYLTFFKRDSELRDSSENLESWWARAFAEYFSISHRDSFCSADPDLCRMLDLLFGKK